MSSQKEMPVEKRFHRSDKLLYEYTTIDVASLHNAEEPTFMRHFVQLHASPNAKWRSIADFVNEASKRIDAGNPALLSVMVETEDFFVALTLSGFHKIIESLPSYGKIPYDEMVDQLAKELVAQRDYSAYIKSAPAGGKKFSDFWPRDERVRKKTPNSYRG